MPARFRFYLSAKVHKNAQKQLRKRLKKQQQAPWFAGFSRRFFAQNRLKRARLQAQCKPN